MVRDGIDNILPLARRQRCVFVGKDCASEGRSPPRDRAATQKEVVQIPQLMVQ